MARPPKEELSYFNLDTAFEENFETLISAFGNDGLAFQVRWWQTAYRYSAGAVDLSDEISLARMCEKVRVEPERFLQIADAAGKLGLIDRDRWRKERVLTSNGARKRLERIKEEREKGRKRAAAWAQRRKEAEAAQRRPDRQVVRAAENAPVKIGDLVKGIGK